MVSHGLVGTQPGLASFPYHPTLERSTSSVGSRTGYPGITPPTPKPWFSLDGMGVGEALRSLGLEIGVDTKDRKQRSDVSHSLGPNCSLKAVG